MVDLKLGDPFQLDENKRFYLFQECDATAYHAWIQTLQVLIYCIIFSRPATFFLQYHVNHIHDSHDSGAAPQLFRVIILFLCIFVTVPLPGSQRFQAMANLQFFMDPTFGFNCILAIVGLCWASVDTDFR